MYMVFKEQVDLLINRETPLQGGVGTAIWKRQQLGNNGCTKYRKIVYIIVAKIIKG